jgi:predicted double-glycine peptidase
MKLLLESWQKYLNESNLKLGANDLPYAFVDIVSAEQEYPELDLDGYLAISYIETKEKRRFRELMSDIEKFAKNYGFKGIVLRAETQDKEKISQDNLENLYKKLGYIYYTTDAYEESDVFMIKRL